MHFGIGPISRMETNELRFYNKQLLVGFMLLIKTVSYQRALSVV